MAKGYIAAIYGLVAAVYADYRYPRICAFAGEVLRALSGAMPVEIDAPPWVQLTVRDKPGQTLIHLVNTASPNPLSPVNPCVEDVPMVGPLVVRVHCDKRPASVTLEPDHTGLSWNWSHGVLTATIRALHIHNALVVTHRQRAGASRTHQQAGTERAYSRTPTSQACTGNQPIIYAIPLVRTLSECASGSG